MMKGLAVGALTFIILVVALIVPFIPATVDVPGQSIPIFEMPDTTIQQNLYVEASSPLSAGQDASVTWSASNVVDVYVFNSTQYPIYAKSGVVTNPMASQTNNTSGTIDFHVSIAGTYYFVVFNANVGVFGGGNLYYSILLYYARGIATSQPSTSSCHENLMTALSGGHC